MFLFWPLESDIDIGAVANHFDLGVAMPAEQLPVAANLGCEKKEVLEWIRSMKFIYRNDG